VASYNRPAATGGKLTAVLNIRGLLVGEVPFVLALAAIGLAALRNKLVKASVCCLRGA